MVLQGVISSIDGDKAKITFPDKENVVSALLPFCECILKLRAMDQIAISVGDKVVVALFSETMQDGLILAKY
jgi:hypothetical protein